MKTVTYRIELQTAKADYGPTYQFAFIRRSESLIPMGTGCGNTVAEAVRRACDEVRERRQRGDFYPLNHYRSVSSALFGIG